MKMKTRDFGQIEIPESEIYHFTQPLFGFEEYTDFVILHDDEIGENIVWLQSVQEPGLCFILVDPSGMSDIFEPELPDETELQRHWGISGGEWLRSPGCQEMLR